MTDPTDEFLPSVSREIAAKLRPFAEDIDKVIAEAGIEGRLMAGTLLDARWVPQGAVESTLALIPGLPCPMRSSVTDQPCVLTWGHPMDSAVRFHRFEPPAALLDAEPAGRVAVSVAVNDAGDDAPAEHNPNVDRGE
jgi:hypothetical protein